VVQLIGVIGWEPHELDRVGGEFTATCRTVDLRAQMLLDRQGREVAERVTDPVHPRKIRRWTVLALAGPNHDLADVERCQALRTVDAVQVGLNLLDHEYLDDRPSIARCAELGIAVTIFEPLASGTCKRTPTPRPSTCLPS